MSLYQKYENMSRHDAVLEITKDFNKLIDIAEHNIEQTELFNNCIDCFYSLVRCYNFFESEYKRGVVDLHDSDVVNHDMFLCHWDDCYYCDVGQHDFSAESEILQNIHSYIYLMNKYAVDMSSDYYNLKNDDAITHSNNHNNYNQTIDIETGEVITDDFFNCLLN